MDAIGKYVLHLFDNGASIDDDMINTTSAEQALRVGSTRRSQHSDTLTLRNSCPCQASRRTAANQQGFAFLDTKVAIQRTSPRL